MSGDGTMGERIDYDDEGEACEAYVARPASAAPAPAVLIIPTVRGPSALEYAVADDWAARGQAGIVLDVYGKAERGGPPEANFARMNEWTADRARLLKRLMAGVDFAAALDGIDPARMAAAGYCFGGLCALDLARSGTDRLKGVVSLHGVLQPSGLPAQPIRARVLVLHGYDDPLAPPAAMTALADELTAAGADWQIHAYGGTSHGFTNPEANAPERGVIYNADAHRRSTAAMRAFVDEVLG